MKRYSPRQQDVIKGGLFTTGYVGLWGAVGFLNGPPVLAAIFLAMYLPMTMVYYWMRWNEVSDE
jgi:hypothetical protein